MAIRRDRVAKPGHLHQDAIGALALDQRLHGAEFVDAALDDLNRLLDGLADPIGDRGRRHGQADHAAAGVADVEASLAAGAEQTADRLRQFAQLRQRRRQIGFLGDADLDAVALGRKAGITDLGIAQRAANVVAHLVELVFLDVVGIDLEQQV